MSREFNFEEELKKLDEAHKAFNKAKIKLQIQEGFCFDLFLKQNKITMDEFYELSEEKQEKIYADYEQRKWK